MNHRIPQEILTEIDELLKKICIQNKKFANIIMNEITSPFIRNISYHRRIKGFLIIRFTTSLSDNSSSFNEKQDYKCELKINNFGFRFEKSNITHVNTYKYTLECKKSSNFTSFNRETFQEYKSKLNKSIPYRLIDANNEIEIFNNQQQILRMENKVNLTCLPSSKGKLYIKKELDRCGLSMKITNPFALEVLNRLGYNVSFVETNRCEHSEVWPILENSVVQLTKKESIHYDRNYDEYYNEETMFVGNNKYENHKNLNAGLMYYTYAIEEREIAKKYFDGRLPIEEVLKLGEQIFLNYEKKSQHSYK